MAIAPITQWDAQGSPIPSASAPTQWDAQGNPISTTPPAGAPATVAPATSPANTEGLYAMHSPDGRAVQIPYSKVHTQMQNGYLFQDKPTLQQYARDQAADPLSEDRIDQFLDKHPWFAAPVTLGKGLGIGLAKTLTGFDKTPETGAETSMQMLAATPAKGLAEDVGEAGENVAEFFSGDELLGMLGKSAKLLPMAERLKAMTGIAQLMDKHPVLAALAKIGSTAVKQGTIAGGQTFVKTGGDAGAAAKAGGETALMSGGLSALGAGGAAAKTAAAGVGAEAAPAVEKTAAGVKIPVAAEAANATATPTAAASAEAYGNLSREAIRDSVEKLADSPRQVEAALNSTHDLTGAVARQQEILKPIYDNLNEVTGGKFRQLNSEVQAAKTAARAGTPEAEAAYKSKLAEMDDLLDQVPSIAGRKDLLQTVKAAWTQNYVLDDFSGNWDRNLNGTPGASQVSNEQRGINGNGLMRDIQKTIATHGREKVEQALGPERLQEWENIARWNQTNAKRKAFNMGVQEVAKALPAPMSEMGKRATAMVAGGAAAHVLGASPYMGALAGEATYESTRMVLNAIKANPKIAQNFMFALESGATAKRYGPFIAGLITKSQTEAQQQQQADEREGEQ